MAASSTPLERLISVSQLLRNVSPQFRLTQLEALLTVATCPGITGAELADRCGLTRSGISRFVDTFSSSGRRDGRGVGALDLVEANEDIGDDRLRPLNLTTRGERLISVLSDLIQ